MDEIDKIFEKKSIDANDIIKAHNAVMQNFMDSTRWSVQLGAAFDQALTKLGREKTMRWAQSFGLTEETVENYLLFYSRRGRRTKFNLTLG